LTSKTKNGLEIIGIILVGITLIITGTSFITSDGYPFMGQNNEVMSSRIYISDKLIYYFDGIENKSIKLIEEKSILSKTPKLWPSSSITLEKNEGIYQESSLYDENGKLLDIARNDSSDQISMSNYRKINPTLTETIIIKEVLNEED
jgi:hypothetical protein